MKLVLYTDGNCLNNRRGKGRGAFAAYLQSGRFRRLIAGYQENTTNNEMELRALLKGLSVLKEPCDVEWFTDSQYVLQGAMRWRHGWKKKNWQRKKTDIPHAHLWAEVSDLIDNQQSFTGYWVKGHAGIEGNEVCDRAASKVIADKWGYDTGLRFGLTEEEVNSVFSLKLQP